MFFIFTEKEKQIQEEREYNKRLDEMVDEWEEKVEEMVNVFLPDLISESGSNDDDEFVETYNKTAQYVKNYIQKERKGRVPRYHKGKSVVSDYWTCGQCGAILRESVGAHYCWNCGYKIRWRSPNCLTGIHDGEKTNGDWMRSLDNENLSKILMNCRRDFEPEFQCEIQIDEDSPEKCRSCLRDWLDTERDEGNG